MTQNNAALSGSTRLPIIDGLRAVSILIVLTAHTLDTFEPENRLLRFLSASFLQGGMLGVEIFFVISGFLITYFLSKEKDRSGSVDLKYFYLRRVCRILPAYYLALGAAFLFSRWGWIAARPSDFFLSALFLQNFVVQDTPIQISHFWSLCVEEQFYLFWPVLFSKVKPGREMRWAFAIAAMGPVVRIANYYALPALRPLLNRHSMNFIDTLMWGCCAALVYRSPQALIRLRHSYRWGLNYFALFLLFVFRPFLSEFGFASAYKALGHGIDGFAIAILLLWLVVIREPKRHYLLDNGWIVKTGLISYSIYLWQQFFMPRGGLIPAGLWPIAWLVIATVSLLSYRVVEQPGIALGRRLRPLQAKGSD